MGLAISARDDYARSLRQLFPEGEFWDSQFRDDNSDLSRWCMAEATELLRLKSRRAKLLNEGFPSTAEETLEDWERVNELEATGLTITQRQQALSSASLGVVRRSQIEVACSIFEATLDKLFYPYTPAFFGRSRFGSRLATPSAMSTVWVYLTLKNPAQKGALLAHLEKVFLGNMILSFFIKGDDGEYNVS